MKYNFTYLLFLLAAILFWTIINICCSSFIKMKVVFDATHIFFVLLSLSRFTLINFTFF